MEVAGAEVQGAQSNGFSILSVAIVQDYGASIVALYIVKEQVLLPVYKRGWKLDSRIIVSNV